MLHANNLAGGCFDVFGLGWDGDGWIGKGICGCFAGMWEAAHGEAPRPRGGMWDLAVVRG